ncbi:glutaredoxin family protein [Bacillus sp. AGMB 02131]|uniref:Glutaredoxin family protein n=1 Tax=Peribacillus faecalis TaxID=2772559 RepID=A0A927CT16_9BACI|nr:glutaredoxin domain-containing protein [Peribacillus faecalis]MBD3106906.1 glutaredoxin family protein [Peribacillus faecalis]
MNKVIIYSQSNCPPCEFAKLYFKNHDIAFEEKNITRDKKAKNEMMVKYDAFSTPVIVINEQAIIGFDQERIEELLISEA